MKKHIFYFSLAYLVLISIHFCYSQVLIDSLTTNTAGEQHGGEFVTTGGWQAVSWEDRIIYDLRHYYTKGHLELDIRNFEPGIQNTNPQHYFISMYSDSILDFNHASYQDSTDKSMWNLGTELDSPNAVNLLSIAENQLVATTENILWESDSTYHISIAWDSNRVSLFVDSVLVLENIHDDAFSLRFVALGRDRTHALDYQTGYSGNECPALLGPIYSNLIVYGDSAVQEIFPDEAITLPVNLPHNMDIYSFDLDISYNPELMLFQSIQKDTNAQQLQLLYNDLQGEIKIGAFSQSVITQRDHVITIIFSTIPDQNQTRFAKMKSVQFYANNVQLPQFKHIYVLFPLDSARSLPVEFTDFQVDVVQNNSVRLTWHTVSEKTNYGFEIQRSFENSVFQKIGFIKGAGTSLLPLEYQYIDKNLRSGIYQYRLKQVDSDGSFSVTETKKVTISYPDKFQLYPNYPNPFSEKTYIPFSTNFFLKDNEIQVTIFDVTGQVVKKLTVKENQQNMNRIVWDGTNDAGMKMPSGNYFIEIKAKNQKAVSKILLIR